MARTQNQNKPTMPRFGELLGQLMYGEGFLALFCAGASYVGGARVHVGMPAAISQLALQALLEMVALAGELELLAHVKGGALRRREGRGGVGLGWRCRGGGGRWVDGHGGGRGGGVGEGEGLFHV